MTNPTSAASSPPSFIDDLYSSWNQAQEGMRAFEETQEKVEFENTFYYMDKTFGPIGKVAACALHRNACTQKIARDLPSYAAYHVPKMAFQTATYLAGLTGQSIYYVGSTVADWLNPAALIDDPENIPPPSPFEVLYKKISDKADSFSNEATSWVTGKTVEEITSDSNPTFHAVDLIGPALFLSLCSHKSKKNLFEALHHAKLLVTNKRVVSTSYTIPTVNSRIPTTISRTKTYTTPALIKDVAMEVAFAALWGAGAYLTNNGIYHEVFKANGGNADEAKLVARAVLITGIIAPIAYEWIKDTLYAPASSIGNDQGIIAPRTPAGAAPYEPEIEALPPAENLSLEENIELLAKYRSIENNAPLPPAEKLSLEENMELLSKYRSIEIPD